MDADAHEVCVPDDYMIVDAETPKNKGNSMHPYIHSVVNLWKTEKNSSKYLAYMAKSCKFALKKVTKSCKTVSKNIAKSCNYA